MRGLLVGMWVVVALVATSCGGASSATAVQETGGADASTSEAADQLIERFGSDEAASNALILAMERGYAGSQVLDAATNDTLSADGTIAGEEPTESPLDLSQYSGEGQDEGAFAPNSATSNNGEVRLAAFVQSQQTPIERMRELGEWNGGPGKSTTEDIVILLKQGFLPKDIIEILIFGNDGPIAHPFNKEEVFCIQVVDEAYCPAGEQIPLGSRPEPTSPAEPESEAPTADETVAPPADTGQLLWSGPMVYTGDFLALTYEPLIEITRVSGTDTFTMQTHFESLDGTFNYDSAGTVCTQTTRYTFVGEGTFYAPGLPRFDGDIIFINGDFTRTRTFDGCPSPTEEGDSTGTIALGITATGIVNAEQRQSGQDWEFSWNLDGVPIPLLTSE